MQTVSVYKTRSDSSKAKVANDGLVLYRSVHFENSGYLEREHEQVTFEILWLVDNCSHTVLSDLSQFIALISDVEKVKGLDNNLELDMLNHLNEIIFLAKLCIWNLGDYTLELSPFSDGYGQYPIDLPEKYRYSIGE